MSTWSAEDAAERERIREEQRQRAIDAVSIPRRDWTPEELADVLRRLRRIQERFHGARPPVDLDALDDGEGKAK